MSALSRESFNAVRVMIALAALVVLGLELYDYSQDGQFEWGSISGGLLLLALAAILRPGRRDEAAKS